jgi:hypothetical protein
MEIVKQYISDDSQNYACSPVLFPVVKEVQTVYIINIKYLVSPSFSYSLKVNTCTSVYH